ncbi:hypothetical protein LPJ57_005289, partial [Coemansia sp. RSA 486]
LPVHSAYAPTQPASVGPRALHKLAWDRPGRRIATGGTDGLIYLYDVGDLASARPEDPTRFARVVSDLTG